MALSPIAAVWEDKTPLIDAEPFDPVTLIAEAWRDAGKRAPTPVPIGTEGCIVPDCITGGWVRLKTSHGLLALCFSHFQLVRGHAI